MDDVEMQPPHGHIKEIRDKKNKAAGDCRLMCIIWILAVVITSCIFVSVELFRDDTHYYVAIDSISDLNPTKGLSFNLTIGVGSWSYGAKACIEPGTYVEVSYHGVQLATSEKEVDQLCVRPRMNAEHRVVARTTGIPVGHLMDSMVANMKRGLPVFDATLHLLVGSENWVSGCGRKRVGTQDTWCDAPNQEPTFP